MITPDDPNFAKNLSDKCLLLSQNNPNRGENFTDISNAFSQSFDLFLNQMNTLSLKILDNFENENKKFTKMLHECEFQQYMTEMIVERGERYKIGAKSSQIKFDNYQHYVENPERTIKQEKYRYVFKINELMSITNSNELCTQKTRDCPKNFYMQVTDTKDVAFEHSKQFTSASSLKNRVYTTSACSSFWSCLNPGQSTVKQSFATCDCNLDFAVKDDYKVNSQSLSTFNEKSQFNMDVVKDIIEKSSQITKTAEKPKKIDSSQNKSTTNSLQSNCPEDSSASDLSNSLQNNPDDNFAPPPDSDFAPPPDSEFAPPPDSEEEEPSSTNVSQAFLYQVKTLYEYNGQSGAELSFSAGQIIDVIEEKDGGWNVGNLNGTEGYFPSNYVQKM